VLTFSPPPIHTHTATPTTTTGQAN
jgi:hypothetical protein